jgi:hypothetical protein
MSRTTNALLVAVALGFGACSGEVSDGAANGETAESLTSYTQRLNAPWGNTDGKGHYQRIALKDDATYVALTAAGQERGSWSVSKPLIGAGKLTIVPTDPPGPSVVYATSLSWFGGKLTLTSGKTKACYDTLPDGYCGIDTDCNGQPYDKQTLSCGAGQHDGNTCAADDTCVNKCVDNGPPPGSPPPDGGVSPPGGPHT